jgi:hypothetical protein
MSDARVRIALVLRDEMTPVLDGIALADCRWCGLPLRRADLAGLGDRLAIEHVPIWRGRDCPGPNWADIDGLPDAE